MTGASSVAPAVRAKIVKAPHEALSNVEIEVATCLHELEANASCDIQPEVALLKIAGALELAVNGDETRKVVVVAFPYRVFTDHVRKIQSRLIAELEKKLRRHVVVYAKRRIVSRKNIRSLGMKVLPRSRTLTAVQAALLEDIVGPAEIVGKRTRVRVDGSKLLKIFLDHKDKDAVEPKLAVFSEVYKKLTTKVAIFSLHP